MNYLALAFLVLATPALADPVVDRVVDGVILPRFAAFSAAAAQLDTAATADCRADNPALREAWNAAYDAWLPASTFRFGPLDEDALGLAIAFWPDPKGLTRKNLKALLSGDGASLASAATYGQVSVAARGLYALEDMLYDPDFNSYGPEDPGCTLVRAAAGDLAATAATAAAEWREAFAPLLRDPGTEGNTHFLTDLEARQAIFTQLVTALGFDEETRLGRPLGTLEKPRPERAESILSGRSLRNIRISLAANKELARALTDGRTETLFDSFAYAESVATKLDDPVFAGVDTASGRLKVNELATAIERVRQAAQTELGAELGVTAGFNSLDGD